MSTLSQTITVTDAHARAEKAILEILAAHYEDWLTQVQHTIGDLRMHIFFERSRFFGKKKVVSILINYSMDIKTSAKNPVQGFVCVSDSKIDAAARENILSKCQAAFPQIRFTLVRSLPV